MKLLKVLYSEHNIDATIGQLIAVASLTWKSLLNNYSKNAVGNTQYSYSGKVGVRFIACIGNAVLITKLRFNKSSSLVVCIFNFDTSVAKREQSHLLHLFGFIVQIGLS